MLSVMSEPDIQKAREDSAMTALQLAGIGLAFFVTVAAQGLVFSYAGSKLVERVRQMMFECMLEQEMGWYDKVENNTGALCARYLLQSIFPPSYHLTLLTADCPGTVRRSRERRAPESEVSCKAWQGSSSPSFSVLFGTGDWASSPPSSSL